ncbi:hypothetical protein ACFX2J_014227 [Malus domestica]
MEVPGLAERMAAIMCVDTVLNSDSEENRESNGKSSVLKVLESEITEARGNVRWLELEDLDMDDETLSSLDLAAKFPDLLALSLCGNKPERKKEDVKLQHRCFSLAACEAQPSSAMAGSATGSSCALGLWSVAMLSGRAQWQCNGCVMAVLDRQCNGCAQWLCSVAVLSKGSGGASSSAPPPWLPSLNEIDKTKVYQYTPKDLIRLLPRSCQ